MRYWYSVAILAALGCNPGTGATDGAKAKPAAQEKSAASKGSEAPESKPAKKTLAFNVTKFDAKTVPKSVKPPGAIVDGLSWEDKRGKNVVVFTRNPKEGRNEKTIDAWLFANHIVLEDGKEPVVLREVKQRASCSEDDRDADLFADWRPSSFGVTDIDKNGLGEATFAYAYTCTSDISPRNYKLFMLEGGEKYILRGQTEEIVGNAPTDRLGGEFKVDDSFKKKPQFLDHAKNVWGKTKLTR